MSIALQFDYMTLDVSTRAVVAEKTGLIRERVKRSMNDMIEIGGWLAEVKAILPYGEFGKWLEAEFEWTRQTAHNLISVAEAFSCKPGLQLDITAHGLYALAAPSTPVAAREEAVAALSEAGERVTTAMAREIIAKHKRPGPEPEPEEEEPASGRDPLPNQSTLLPPEDEDEDDEDQPEDEEDTGPAQPHPDEKFFDNLLDLLLTAFISVDRRGGIAEVARHSGPQAAIAAITRLRKLSAYCDGFINRTQKGVGSMSDNLQYLRQVSMVWEDSFEEVEKATRKQLWRMLVDNDLAPDPADMLEKAQDHYVGGLMHQLRVHRFRTQDDQGTFQLVSLKLADDEGEIDRSPSR